MKTLCRVDVTFRNWRTRSGTVYMYLTFEETQRLYDLAAGIAQAEERVDIDISFPSPFRSLEEGLGLLDMMMQQHGLPALKKRWFPDV